MDTGNACMTNKPITTTTHLQRKRINQFNANSESQRQSIFIHAYRKRHSCLFDTDKYVKNVNFEFQRARIAEYYQSFFLVK